MSPKSIIIGTVLITAVCLSTALMLHYNKKSHPLVKKEEPTDPNLIVLDTSFTLFNTLGQMSALVASPKIIHYPERNSTVLIMPKIKVYTKNRIPWNISADNGLATDGSKTINLWGHVIIHQPNQPESPETTISTSQITFYPNRSYADTDQEVVVIKPGSRLESKGMSVDFKSGVLTTKSKTRGTYEPKTHKK